MDMEADRIRDLAFDPKIIESERGVVYSERRTSVDNSNFGILREQLQAAAFIAHPYHWPVVGWPSDIEAWTMEDLKNHFRMGYAPNNCIMVVVGDVTSRARDRAGQEVHRADSAPGSSTARPHQGTRAAGRAPRHREEGSAVADPNGRLSCARIEASRSKVLDLVVDRPAHTRAEFAIVQADGGRGASSPCR